MGLDLALSVSTSATTTRGSVGRLPAALDRRFEAVVFDWDGTAVPDRAADASRLRKLVEELSSVGLDLAVVTGTHVGNVDGQLGARPAGPGRLYLGVNRGSETFLVDADGIHLVDRREATPEENAALDAAAEATVAELARRGLRAEIVSQRLNRRKIDLIPEPEWADPPKARIAELLAAVEARLAAAGLRGLDEAVELAEAAARMAGLHDPRVTSDAKHVEIGLTDKSDAARWMFAELERHGIQPGLVLVAGDEFGPLGGLPGSDSLLLVPEAARATAISVGAEPTGAPPNVIHLAGGPQRFVAILEDQLDRRRRGDVPDVDADPVWTLTVEGFDPQFERVHESLLTLADGRIGTRGSAVLAHPASAPAVLAAGVYDGVGPDTDLAPCPDWTRLPDELPVDPLLRRRLDLRTGLLRQELARADRTLTVVQLSSFSRPRTVSLRAQGASLPEAGTQLERGGLTAALSDQRRADMLDRIGAYRDDGAAAQAALAEAEQTGFERLLREHRETWAQRWETADILVERNGGLTRDVRFALFHLMGSVADEGEAAVGARGLTGHAYRGHVFWDSDVFVSPFLAATHPRAARAMLEYRVRRLPAALEMARRLGRRGARFPWESAADGFDVTPTSVRDRTGRLVRIRTGELEEHIVADVAWAASTYLDWTGDAAFATGPGRQLLVETARYWASRIRVENRRAHIYGVIGPDEYHEPVDDNAFTNVMARWNLRRAAELDGDEAERAEWLRLADALVDGYDEQTGIYEQFAGFFRLEPLVIADVAPRRPIAADLLLGAERVRGAQVLKQADVLMLHHLVPDEVAPGSLEPNLVFYEPRTAHGSSLSPAIHASLLARAGRFADALAALRIAARIDLDDLTGSTAGGLHLATMGGLWQALVIGFAGVRPRGNGLLVDPRLPSEWHALEVRLRFHGEPLALRIDHGGVSLRAPGLQLHARDGIWEVTP
jgi:trehalose/maltose hydrolase-like predicted phosphorylase